jgi:antitoxin component of RelBE/YafQ-DinJ toxin-antitoxin module
VLKAINLTILGEASHSTILEAIGLTILEAIGSTILKAIVKSTIPQSFFKASDSSIIFQTIRRLDYLPGQRTAL